MSLYSFSLFLIILLSYDSYGSALFTPKMFTNQNVTVKYLITSMTGMQFQKVNNPDGTVAVIYDCSVGVEDSGAIEIYDKFHPDNTKSISIENCNDITISLCSKYLDDFSFCLTKVKELEEIIAKNIHTLAFFEINNYHSSPYNFRAYHIKEYYNNPKKIHLSNIQNLKFLEDSCSKFQNAILEIENATINKLNRNAISRGVAKLHLQNVQIKSFEKRGIYLNYENEFIDPVLIMKDTHFGNIDSHSFFVNGSEVEISNNFFQYLDDDAFNIRAHKKFTFTNNFVKKMGAPFRVNSSNVQITGNTFDVIKKPWMIGIKVESEVEKAIFNVSRNSLKLYASDFFLMDTDSNPDIIRFHENHFNCSCQFGTYFENSATSSNILNRGRNNVCVNLDNCPLVTVLKHMNEVCSDTFNCLEAEKPRISTQEYLNMILSTLKNMDAKLHILTSVYAPSRISNEIGTTKDELTETTRQLLQTIP